MSSSANYTLEQILIGGKEVTPQNIDTISIFEGLTLPAITGSALLTDREAILEMREIFAGDLIEISFVSKANITENFTFKGVITAARGETSVQHSYPVTIIEFCSPWWFEATTRQVSKAYKNQTWVDIIMDLVEVECGGDFLEAFGGKAEKIERFVAPLWTPAHTIKYLMSIYALSGKGGYLLFDRLDQNLTTLTSMEQLFVGLGGYHKSDIMFNAGNQLYEGAVNTIYMESYFDALRYINNGTFHTDYVNFDYDRTQIYKSSSKATDIEYAHLGAYPPILESHLDDRYKSVKSTFNHFQTSKLMPERSNVTHIDAIRDNNYVSLFSDMIKFNALLLGATDRHVGQIVKVEFPSINTKTTHNEMHRFLEGYFLIRNIQHIFRNDNYSQAITFCKDGFGAMERKDLARWNEYASHAF